MTSTPTGKRQLVRSDEVRAPQTLNDQLTETQIRDMVSTVVTQQDFISLLTSQFRIAQGGTEWTNQAPPGAVPGEIEVEDELMQGVQDGTNAVYTTQSYFLQASLQVYLNGQRLHLGRDFTVSEPGGTGTGFNTVTLINRDDALPIGWEVLTASYSRNL